MEKMTMTKERILQALENPNKKVYWKNTDYQVLKDKNNEYLICYLYNETCIGLLNKKGELTSPADEFFILSEY